MKVPVDNLLLIHTELMGRPGKFELAKGLLGRNPVRVVIRMYIRSQWVG